MKFKPVYGVVAGVVIIALFAVIGLFSTFNTVQKEGVNWETQLNAQYLANQNELSSYVSGFYEQLGVADRKSEKLNEILVEAVKGRYEGHTSAQPGQGQLFSAITEAYPDLTANLNVYDKIVDYITGGREAYKSKQDKLLDMLGRYDNWRQSGLVHSRVVSMVGYPSNSLEARIGNNVTHGEDARNQMYRIVLTDAAVDAYETGTMDPLSVDPAK